MSSRSYRLRLINLLLFVGGTIQIASSQAVYNSGQVTDCANVVDTASRFTVSVVNNSIVYNVSGTNYFDGPVGDELFILVGGIYVWGSGTSSCVAQDSCSTETGLFESHGTVPLNPAQISFDMTAQDAAAQGKPVATEFHLVDASSKNSVWCVRSVVAGSNAGNSTASASTPASSGLAAISAALKGSAASTNGTATATTKIAANSTTNGTRSTPTTDKSIAATSTASRATIIFTIVAFLGALLLDLG